MLQVAAESGVNVHVIPCWHSGWQVWTTAGIEFGTDQFWQAVDWTTPSEDGQAEWLAVKACAAASAPRGQQVVIAVPQVCNLSIVADADVRIHDKVEASSVVVQTTRGHVRAGKVRAERVVLHSERGDVAVTSAAEGGGSIYGRRVFVKRLLAPRAEVVADEWAVVQAAYASQLAVRVGDDADSSGVAPPSAEAYRHHGCVLVPTLHGSAEIDVGAEAAGAARRAGQSAVLVAGVTGTVSVRVRWPPEALPPNPDAQARVSPDASIPQPEDRPPLVVVQFDELAADAAAGSTVGVVSSAAGDAQHSAADAQGAGAGAVRVVLNPPCAARLTAPSDAASLRLRLAGALGSVSELSGSHSAVHGDDGKTVMLRPLVTDAPTPGDRFGALLRAWPRPNKTTPGVNRGLWPNRDEMLQQLRSAADSAQREVSPGKISMESRPSEAFFDPSTSHSAGAVAGVHLTGKGLLLEADVQEWSQGVAAKARMRQACGKALAAAQSDDL